MKNIKKWLALLMAGLIMSASLIACDSGSSSDDDDDDDDSAVTEEYATLEALYDAMESADNLTISGEADGMELEIIYDGDKIQATVSMSGEALIECFDKGADKMYIRIGDEWYETELESAQLEDVDVDAMIDEIKDMEDAELEKDGDDYIIKGDDETMKVSFSGKVSLPKDAKSMEELDPGALGGMLG